MTTILNYSENDFPSLGSSVRNKVRKTNPKTSSSTVNQFNGNVSESVDEELEQITRSEQIPTLSCHSFVGNNSEFNGLHKKPPRLRKPKPTESVSIGDFLEPEKSRQKNRVRVTKRIKENFILSGNPLDADSPIRRKGFMNLSKKPKRLSKIKTAVHEGREEMKKIMEYSSLISVEKETILVKSEIPEDYIWKSVIHGKIKDLKTIMNYKRKPELEESTDNIVHETTYSMRNKENQNKAISSASTDDKDSYRRISLQTILESSEIPPFKILIHHHNFKSYCDNCVTEELNRSSTALISQIVRYQFNKYQTNPTKAVANKRYVIGLKQVTKYLKMNKIQFVVIVPDMEDSVSKTVEELKSLAQAYCTPYLFALSRRKLGFLMYKKVGVGCFGVLDLSGAELNFEKTLACMSKAKLSYKEKCSKAKEFYDSYFVHSSEIDHPGSENINELIEKFIEKCSLDENTENSNTDAAS